MDSVVTDVCKLRCVLALMIDRTDRSQNVPNGKRCH